MSKTEEKRDKMEELIAFPSGIPRPHLIRDWDRGLESTIAEEHLTDVAAERLPAGKFDSIWPPESLLPAPKLSRDATFSEQLSHRKFVDEIESRTRHNEKVMAERDTWFKDGNDRYFKIMTDTMVRTQPSLRQVLRDRCRLPEGRFDGVKARKLITKWVERLHTRNPQADYYEDIQHVILKKRLPEGASERAFAAVVRRYTHDVNPFTRSPFEGEALGRLIIEKIMPPYITAGESLIQDLMKEKKLDDIMEVEDRCTIIVARRAKKEVASNLAETVEAMLSQFEKVDTKGNEPPGEVPDEDGGVGKPLTQPTKVDPKKGIFCGRCPHQSKGARSIV